MTGELSGRLQRPAHGERNAGKNTVLVYFPFRGDL